MSKLMHNVRAYTRDRSSGVTCRREQEHTKR